MVLSVCSGNQLLTRREREREREMSQYKLKGYSIDNFFFLFFFFCLGDLLVEAKRAVFFFIGKVKKRELSALFTAKY